MPDKEALSRPLLDDGKQQHVAIGVGSTKGEPRRPSQAEGVVPIVLETRGLNYYLTSDKGQEKRILRDVNLRFQSGVLAAVMGCVDGCVWDSMYGGAIDRSIRSVRRLNRLGRVPRGLVG